MARPTEDPQSWATDAAYDATGKAWDGLAPTLEPSAGLAAEGFEPGARVNARVLNWLFKWAGKWLAYLASFTNSDDEVVYPASKTRTFVIVPKMTGTGGWKTDGATATATATSDFGYCHLNEHLRTGQVLTTIAFSFTSGGAGTTALYLKKYVVGSGASTLKTTNQAGSGTVTWSTINETIDRATTLYFIEADAADGGDVVGPITITLTETILRNPG